MIWRCAAAWGIVGMLAASASAFRVVTTSGTRVDGSGIAGFLEPQVGAGSIWFRSASTSVTVGGRSFATGDPVPSGFGGTIEEILDAQIAGERAGLLLATTGPDVSYGIFLLEGDAATPLVTTSPGDPTSFKTFVMNGAGDIAYLARPGPGSSLIVRTRAAGTSVTVAPAIRTPRNVVIDEAGNVAWIDSRRTAIGRWDAAHGPRVTDITRPYPRGRASPVAIHAPEGVVVAQRDVVQLWTPDDMTITLLQAGDLVDGVGIQRVYGDVGFVDDGMVAIRVRGKHQPTRYVCVKGDVKTFCDSAGRTSASTRVAVSSASSVFRARGGALAALVRPGDDIPGAGTLADVARFVVKGDAVTFLGVLTDDRRVLARRSERGISVLAVSGQPVGSGVLSLDSFYAARGATLLAGASVTDADGSGAEDSSGLALLRGATVRTLRRPRRDGAFGSPMSAVFAGGGAIVLSTDPDAVLAATGRRLRPIVVAGKGPARAITSFESMVASGSAVVIVGTDTTGAAGLYELRAERLSRVMALPSTPSVLTGGAQDDVALVVATTRDQGVTYVDQLWTVRSGRKQSIAAVGDATPLGALMGIGGVALNARTIVVAAFVAGSGPHRALLTIHR